jgi:hypothetical protein
MVATAKQHTLRGQHSLGLQCVIALLAAHHATPRVRVPAAAESGANALTVM